MNFPSEQFDVSSATRAAFELLAKMPGISEVSHVITFRCVRESKSGPRFVIVELQDKGYNPGRAASRYYAKATSEDGKTAYGSGGASIEEALGSLRWGEFDVDARM